MIDDSTSLRTDLCGRLRASDVGRQVVVCGWVDRRREHSEHLAFVDLRDYTGIIQCVVDGARDLRPEFVLRITGTVSPRLDGTVNEKLATGEIELHDCAVEVLSQAEPPPFPMDERTDVDETIRLRHRYVDLRKPRLQQNLRARGRSQQCGTDGHGGAGLCRDRDADAHRLNARGGPRLRGAFKKGTGRVLRPPAKPAALQAALAWWADSIATTRSPDASAMRI